VVTTLPGNVTLTNPFKVLQTLTLRGRRLNGKRIPITSPQPHLRRPLLELGDGKSFYYALNTKVEKRLQQRIQRLQTFSYSKQISENNIYNQTVARRSL